MTDCGDKIDLWLDDALAAYGESSLPVGFEARVLGRLQARAWRRAFWPWLAWASAAFTAVVIFAVVYMPRAKVEDPPQLRAKIVVPEMIKVSTATKPRLQGKMARPDSTRGVPIVPAPLTSQEEAILRLVRNSRARQLAAITPTNLGVLSEKNVLEFRELNIPPISGEKDK